MLASQILNSAASVPKARMASTWRMGLNVVRPEDQHSVSALYLAIAAGGIYFASVAKPNHKPESPDLLNCAQVEKTPVGVCEKLPRF